MLLSVLLGYFIFWQWLPITAYGRKSAYWLMLGIPGIWWVDLRVDGARKGTIWKNPSLFPHPGSVIAASSTSPLDALYLATIFDPVFTASYPTTRQIEHISLFSAVMRAFSSPKLIPNQNARLTDLEKLLRRFPDRVIVVFPECTTSNGRGILPFSPSLLTAPPRTKVFPFSLKYHNPDITTPLPGRYFVFLWNLCGTFAHAINVRVAQSCYNTSNRQDAKETSKPADKEPKSSPKPLANGVELLSDVDSSETHVPMTSEEKIFLDKVGESLARVGRIKRVGLGVREKKAFIRSWKKRKQS